VPALNMVRRFAQGVKQHAQLHSIDAALELFNNEFDGYPDSSALDPDNQSYCGAMKLCEAMLGQDMLGFHKNSVFRSNGMDALDVRIYGLTPADSSYKDNLTKRKGPFLPLDNADVYQMSDIYGTNVGNFLPDSRVLCDVYSRTLPTGKKAGMPVLYYKADTTNTLHDPADPHRPTPTDSCGNIYNYWDNQELILLGKPWVTGGAGTTQKDHNMGNPQVFYDETQSEKVTTTKMPRRPDTYILISAGFDGEYGTSDDICNYQKQ